MKHVLFSVALRAFGQFQPPQSEYPALDVFACSQVLQDFVCRPVLDTHRPKRFIATLRSDGAIGRRQQRFDINVLALERIRDLRAALRMDDHAVQVLCGALWGIRLGAADLVLDIARIAREQRDMHRQRTGADRRRPYPHDILKANSG